MACCSAGHSPEQILEYVSNRVAAIDRSRVHIKRTDKRQTSSHISPCDGPHFRIIGKAIREIMGRPEVGIVFSKATCYRCSASLAESMYFLDVVQLIKVFIPQEGLLVAPYLVVGEACHADIRAQPEG